MNSFYTDLFYILLNNSLYFVIIGWLLKIDSCLPYVHHGHAARGTKSTLYRDCAAMHRLARDAGTVPCTETREVARLTAA